MLDATDVTVTLGRRRVLDGVNFQAAPGELTAIVGPNGSGKTTLLRAVTGDLGYRGRITLAGKELSGIPAWRLALRRAVLAQFTPLAFPFTVAEVVGLGQIRKGPGSAADLTPRALARVGLCGYASRPYQELSGGEQQRVQLARVLCQVWEPVEGSEARWLFLDEPVSSLDIAHQLQVMQIARDFADVGGGVVAIMHDLNLTAMFADSVALIAEGRLLEQASPEVLLRDDLLSRAYGCSLRVSTPPPSGPYVLPHAARLG
ncbi:heme ABC transporter ATP-binding protein [Salipiger mangrovisoli]|uniref:Heme ABC transporter ATP-binding protein n=1 Tax=Salipiger mangrovisoli TaxID=2865933 RepID=A0ABR9XBB4_9RHOB|nr:heme ABC transporter ATP-binding protein [Salipiger mangrovisoli]MBE9640712.1 heme ABC transporter ATP-binding protein [Salipiger mangrovisoli]